MRLSARRRAAMIAAGALAVAGIAVPVGSAYAATACDVVYATNDWPGGFTEWSPTSAPSPMTTPSALWSAGVR